MKDTIAKARAMASSQDVNIYHRILKLAPHVTEPDAYELLGVAQFEPDQTKIKRAAMDRNAMLQRLQNSENYEDVKRLEREVGQAMVCLTDSQQKAEYDKGLSTSIFLIEPPPIPPAPAGAVTRSIASFGETTVEVEILPDEEPQKPASPIPASGIRMLPPPTKLVKTGKKSKKPGESDAKKFLPGEAPWRISGSWPGTRPWIVLGLGSGLCLMLFLGLLIAFWPASSKEEPAPAPSASKDKKDSNSKTVATSESPSIEPGKVEEPPGGSNLTSEGGAAVVGPGFGNSSQAGIGVPTPGAGEPPGMQDVTSLQKWGECLAHANAVTQMEFTADGKYLITAGSDGMIRVWDAQTAQQHRQISIAPPAAGPPGPFGFPGAPMAPGGMSPFAAPGVQSTSVRHWAVSQGNLLAATADGRTIQLWDIPTAGNRGTIANSQDDYLWFGFSPAGDSFVTLNTQGLLKSCSVTTGQSQMAERISLQGGVAAAAAPRVPLLMATGDLLGGITLWNTDYTKASLPGTGTPALKMIFSPDGKLLASSDAVGIIRILSTESRKEIRRQRWPAFAVSDMRFTNDGRALLVLSADGMLRGLATDPADSAGTGSSWKQTDGNLLAVSPDGNLLAVAGGGNTFGLSSRGQLELWGVGAKPATFNPQNYVPSSPLPTASAPLMASTPSPNVPQAPLASAKAITAGNLDQIQELASFLGHESSKRRDSVHAVEFHPDGGSFISGGSDSVASIWNPHANPPVKLQTLSGHANPVLAVATSGPYAATGCSKGYIKLWDRIQGTDLNPNLKKPQHTGSVQDLAFSPNGSFLASVGDKSVKIWTLPALTEAVNLPSKHKATVTGVTWIDDNQILTCDAGNQFYQWKNLPLGVPIGLGAPMGFGGLGVPPQAGRAAAVPGLFGGFAPQLGLANVTVLGNIKGFGFRINGIDSTKGNKVAFASSNADIGLWNGQAEDPLRLEGHKKTASCVAFSPDGSLLASAGGEDHAIRFWDAETGQPLYVLPVASAGSTPSQILCLDFSSDGRWLVTGDADGRLKLWGLP